jgi:hypothetical protein
MRSHLIVMDKVANKIVFCLDDAFVAEIIKFSAID